MRSATAVSRSAASALGEVTPPGMAKVPGGTFRMGTDDEGELDERPAHDVVVSSFWLDVTEVTNEDYEACVVGGVCGPPNRKIASSTHAGPDSDFSGPRQPVVGVRWDDARTYCTSKGKRLPREAEFERAIRGSDGRRYPWGSDEPTPELTVFGRLLGHGGKTDDVGSHPKGRGPYGHDDLAGNVWEWMEDAYDPLAYSRPSARTGTPGTCEEILEAQDTLRREGRQGFTGTNPIPRVCERVLRGGAFNYTKEGLRSSNRVHHPGSFRLVMSGFRCAKDAHD
ncbi:MAG: formylglycine-generating enzyme family protein [Polyangiaceae bacterium]